jgi:hypothetical protein
MHALRSTNTCSKFIFKLNLITTTSSLQIGRTYLQMRLTIDRGDIGLEDVLVELSLENFYSFLGQIEICKGYLDLLSDQPK